MRAWTALLLLTLPFAGCLGFGSDDAPVETASMETGGADGALPANLTENATATRPDDLTGGHAPHIHDYWGTSDRVTLFHDEIDVSVFSSATFLNLFLRKQPALGGTFWELPEGATVYEGTGQVVLTASWTDATITGLAVSYKPANMPWDWTSFSEPVAFQNGQPLTIEVAPAMTDMPHEAVSRWAFYFTAHGAPSVAQGTVDLQVEIVRMRDVTEFPGHPDMYEDVDRYLLADKDFTFRSPSFVTEISNIVLTGQSKIEWIVPDGPVPMETRALLVEVTVASSSAANPLAKQNGLYLFYRTASGDRDFLREINATENVFTFAVPVDTDDVDSPYAEASQWRFGVIVRESVETPVGGGSMCSGCLDQEVSGHIVVTAFDEDPTGGKMEDDEDDEDA